MNGEPNLSTVAALIGEPTRAAILSALMNGGALPASDLAARACITPQTASAHLARLVDGGLLSVVHSGRHRYYRLASADIAQALEALSLIAPPPKPRRETPQVQQMRFARTCYDHLAGKLGVAVTQALVENGLLAQHDTAFDLTDSGAAWFQGHHIDLDTLSKSRRPFARPCLDWSERQFHLAGSLGAALASGFLKDGWVTRIPGGRALRLTEPGRRQLRRELGLDLRNVDY